MSFDPETFLNTTIDEAMDTTVVPCPVGEFPALAEKVEVKPWAKSDGSASGLKLVILWEVQDEGAQAVTGRNPLRVPQEQMLDLSEDGQSLDFGKGKNVGLGRIREALGMNTPGQPFSFGMIQGQMAKVNVAHRPYNDDLIAYVKAITKLG